MTTARQQQQPSWIKRMLVDPDEHELDATIHEMKQRAHQRNASCVKIGNRPLYHDLYFEWLDAVLTSPTPTLHHKQFAVLYFLYTDSGFREYVAGFENNLRRFNLFMRRLEADMINLTTGVKPDGNKYDLSLLPSIDDNSKRDTGTFVFRIIHVACNV